MTGQADWVGVTPDPPEHDCAVDGHEYTEISATGRGLIGLYCERCDTRWAVTQITNGSSR